MSALESNPKISVIMATHNSQNFLEEAILSILNQTFKDLELIIVDDYSTDKKTIEIIKKYSCEDSRIKYFLKEKNEGPAISRNFGLEKATGKYLAILDSDDISLPNRLETQFNFLEKNPDYFLICSSFQEINERGEILNTLIKEIDYHELSPKDILNDENRGGLFYMRHSSFFFKNTKEFFYRDKLKYAQDTDLFLRILSEGYKIKLLKDLCIQYRIHDNSITSSKLQIQKEFGKNVCKWFLERKNLQKDSYDEFDPIKLMTDTKLNTVQKNRDQRLVDSIYFNKEKTIKEIRRDFLRFSSEGTNIKSKGFFIYAYLKTLIPRRFKDRLWSLYSKDKDF